MASHDPLPNRDTLLMWISAYFDGELTDQEEAQLFAAMAEDTELEAEFLQMERLLGGDEQLPGLTDAILSATAPSAVSATADGAALLASAHADAELEDEGSSRLFAVLSDNPAAARDAAAFFSAAEGVSAALSALPEAPSVVSAAAEAAQRAHTAVAEETRAGELYSAALDAELDAAEASELDALLAQGRTPDVAFAAVQEAVAVSLRAPCDDPAAARAGAAAMHVIEAEAARAADAARTPAAADAAPVSLADRLRTVFVRFAAPLSVATAAAAVFLFIQQPEKKPGAGTEAPPTDWLAAFPDMQDVVDEEMLAAAQPEDLEVLGDNSDTEVQALDSSAQMAAVFSTEATSITVIWVPEAMDDDAPEETGT